MRYSSVVERALRLLGFGVPGLMMVSAWVLMGEAWPCSSRLTEEQKQKDRTATWCTVEKYCSLFSVTLLWEENIHTCMQNTNVPSYCGLLDMIPLSSSSKLAPLPVV